MDATFTRNIVHVLVVLAMFISFDAVAADLTTKLEPRKAAAPPSTQVDVGVDFPGPWFNDQNAATPQVLRDYSGLKPIRVDSASVLLRELEFISWHRDPESKSVAVAAGGGKAEMWVASPNCRWLFYFAGSQLMVQSVGCEYPIGVRGYFDVTTIYTK